MAQNGETYHIPPCGGVRGQELSAFQQLPYSLAFQDSCRSISRTLDPFQNLAQANPVFNRRPVNGDDKFRDRGRGVCSGVESKLRNSQCNCLIEGIGLHLNSMSNTVWVGERDSASGHIGHYSVIFAFCSPKRRATLHRHSVSLENHPKEGKESVKQIIHLMGVRYRRF